MHAGAGTANMRRWRGCLPGATNDTYGWFPDKWPPRDHGYLWLLEKFGAQGLRSHAKLVVFDMRGAPRPSAVERVVVAGAAVAVVWLAVALASPGWLAFTFCGGIATLQKRAELPEGPFIGDLPREDEHLILN